MTGATPTERTAVAKRPVTDTATSIHVREPSDPRPLVRSTDGGWVVAGWRCGSCGLARATAAPWCASCRGPLVDEEFGPRGIVWSSTVVHLQVGEIVPPYSLAYVDLQDGPRILAHTDPSDTALSVGIDVVLSGVTAWGDPLVRSASLEAADQAEQRGRP